MLPKVNLYQLFMIVNATLELFKNLTKHGKIFANFMHPSGPSRSLVWPQQEDTYMLGSIKTFLFAVDVP